MAVLQLKLNQGLFLKDPQSTELGGKILSSSIQLIDELGFEAFTFKKLSIAIDSTEASIYRYFENKHRMLVYLITWYWAWMEYRITIGVAHMPDPKDKLDTALRIISEKKAMDQTFPDVDEEALQRIVISESDKTYLTKQVDTDNQDGLFKGYKSLCREIASYVKMINPDYPYAHALVSTVLEASNHQLFFASHLPSLTDKEIISNPFEGSYEFLKSLVFQAIKK